MSQLLRDTRCHGKARRERKGVFRHLSEHFGYDITTDDPHMMVSHYQIYTVTPYRETEEELADIADDALVYRAYRVTSAICFLFSMRYSMITITKIKDIWKSVSKDL